MSLPKSANVDLAGAYARYADMLYRIALAQLCSREDAEDAVQDAFARYLSSAADFSSSEHERAWLIRVTVNRCRDIQRSKKYRAHASLEEAGSEAASSDNDISELMGIISVLPEKYKTVIILHHLEGFSVEEAAQALGVSSSGIKMRLSRGRELLKKHLEKEGYYVRQK